MKFDDFGQAPIFIICIQERDEIFPQEIRRNEEAATQLAKNLVDDALPNNSVLVFKVLLRVKEWSMRAIYTPDGEAICKRDPSHACAGGLFEENEDNEWICNRCGEMMQ